jgi:6-phosphogluconolactonase
MTLLTFGRQIFRFIALVVIAISLSVFLFAKRPIPRKYLVYVGTYTEHGSKGIYSYRFDSATGKLTSPVLAAESVQPSFLALAPNGKFLYAVNELEKYNGQATGAVSAFAIQPETGKLSLLNQVASRGEDPAHVVLDKTGKYVLAANYTSGSVTVFPILKDGHLGDVTSFVQHHGHSVNPDRQQGPHAHAIAISPDNRFALVADLGLDQLLVYKFDASKGKLGADPGIVKTAPGAGPRHLVFSSSGRFLYVINEMQSTVVAYSYNAASGSLHELQTISTLPKNFGGESTGAEIEIDPSGKFLFASNRPSKAENGSIAVFAIDARQGTLSNIETDSTGGRTPRNFAIDPTGLWLLAANQDSDNVVIFRIDGRTGHLTPTGESVQLSSPVCLRFLAAE